GAGIKTPSTIFPSASLNVFLMVLSELNCERLIWAGLMQKDFPSFSRNSLERLVISSKLRADFAHNHSYTCLARKAGSPQSDKKSLISPGDSFRMFFNPTCSFTKQIYGEFVAVDNFVGKQHNFFLKLLL